MRALCSRQFSFRFTKVDLEILGLILTASWLTPLVLNFAVVIVSLLFPLPS